jgi:hypothetical protein
LAQRAPKDNELMTMMEGQAHPAHWANSEVKQSTANKELPTEEGSKNDKAPNYPRKSKTLNPNNQP